MKRTYSTQAIKYLDKKIKINGWINSIRNHGGVMFLDIRDIKGIIQIVLSENEFEKIQLSKESVVEIIGTVKKRSDDMINKKIPTGMVEVKSDSIKLLSKSEDLPFPINTDGYEINEEIRLKYRYLDIRRDRVKENILFRNKFFIKVREYLNKREYTEVQTPLLTVSSPEGARDFLVPSRFHPGTFYSLPQAPQMFKQLLMVGGIEKYFQIAPCFRDEDPRSDRHAGAFYQIDVEESFTNQENLFELIQDLCKYLVENLTNKKIISYPIPQITYKEAMNKYGSDKPDLRYDLHLHDISDIAKKSSFNSFKKSESIKAIISSELKGYSITNIKKFESIVQDAGAFGLAFAIVDENNSLKGQLAKFLNKELQVRLIKQLNGKVGDVILIVGDKLETANSSLGKLRIHLAEQFSLADDNELSFVFVTDFPMYEFNEDRQVWDFSHNPFSMPKGNINDLNIDNINNIIAIQYDLALNGFEIMSGSIRNYDSEKLIKLFELVGYDEKEIMKRFGHMYNAFKFGAPPHGGFAIGADRMIAVLLSEKNIREIYPFPKNSNAKETMTGAPSHASVEQLKELNISILK